MPTVPVAERQETTAPLNVPQVSQPRDIGGGFEQVTQAAVGFGKQLQDIAAAQKSMIDKAVVSEADFRLSQLKSELEVKRNQLKGRDAAGALDAIQEEYRTATEEIEKGLTSDAQVAAYRNRVQHHWAGPGGLYESTLKYSDGEINRYATENFNAVVDLRVKDAVEKSDDPEVFQQSLAELQAIIKDRYADSAVAESVYNDHLENINAGIKQLNIETERALKREADALKLEANNDLSELFFDDTLTLKDIKDREVALGPDYERWVKAHKKTLERKEKENKTGKKPVDNADSHRERTIQMLQLSEEEDFGPFKEAIIDDIDKGKLTPQTGKRLIGEAQKQFTLNSEEKAWLKDISKKIKDDFNAGLYGDVADKEVKEEYFKQIRALQRWVDEGKNPEEYYLKLRDAKARSFMQRALNIFLPEKYEVGPELTPEQVRVQAEETSKREKAIKILRDAGLSEDEQYVVKVMEQL